MWTPRRVLLLLVNGLLFLGAYGVYLFFFGGIDSLPPLPPAFLQDETTETWTETGPTLGEKERRIIEAFGAGCEELHRDIKLLVKDRGLVLAAGQFTIEEDGRVKLAPFSCALFPKGKDAGRKEINTVQCDFAFLTLDKPVQLPSELANRKVTAVELRGGSRGVTIINNRGTPEKKDDVEVTVLLGPLFYEERRNLIWTDGFVKMQDFQSQPKPTVVTAKGMELHLSPESSPNKPKTAKPGPAPARPKGEAVSNVDLLILRSNVNMHLYVDTNDGFLGAGGAGGAGDDGSKPRPPPDPKKGPPEKSHVYIKTNGPFTYDLPKELAWFDCPPVLKGGAVPAAPEQVLVSREHPEKKFDQLVCDHLKLQFRKKTGPRPAPAAAAPRDDPGGGDKEIETAIATARPGQQVFLTMDTENLEAYGSELHYHCAELHRGPQTLLRGTPMRAVKDGHKVTARELHLTGGDKDGKGKAADGKGPGRIDLADAAKAKKDYPVHITWRDTLVSTQERDGDKVYEKWTITGDAAYVDDEQHQELRGKRIDVWLEPNDPERGGPKAAGGPKQKIHKVEAFEKVFARSQETTIKRADHLLIVFRPEVAPGGELPLLPEPPAAAPKVAAAQPAPPSRPAAVVGKAPAEPAPKNGSAGTLPATGGPVVPVPVAPDGTTPAIPVPQPPAPANDKDKPRKPIVLDADDVVIYVANAGAKKQLEEVIANGKVHVVQEADKKDEKGLDITGDLLNLTQDAKGNNVLTVHGDSRKHARLEMGETILVGPKVVIDQVRNVADVEGQGAMEMPSKTSLDGDKPARPGARMTIHWNRAMTFDGKTAHFTGGVIGYQDESSIKCESMDAIMDRVVVFKENQKAGQGAKVERLFCDRKVFAADEQRGPDGKRQQASLLECHQLKVDNLYGPTHASGPGRLHHLAPGDADGGAGVGPPGIAPPGVAPPGVAPARPGAPAKQPRKEMQLTRIDFKGWMFSNTKATYKNATFRVDVEVFHVPSEVFEVQLDPDRPPKDGFYLKCQNLQLLARKTGDKPGDKTVQSMVGDTQVFFRTQEFFGFSDVVKFDEASDLIIFEASPGNMVRLFKRVPGREDDRITGEKVLYNRKTGEFKIEKTGVINSSRLEDLNRQEHREHQAQWAGGEPPASDRSRFGVLGAPGDLGGSNSNRRQGVGGGLARVRRRLVGAAQVEAVGV